MENLILPFWLQFIISWATVAWIIYRIFNATGEVVNERTKTSTSNWLRSIKNENDQNWASQIINLFDKVFSKKLLSARCFLMSCLFSTITFVAIFLSLNGETKYFFLQSPPWETNEEVKNIEIELSNIVLPLALKDKDFIKEHELSRYGSKETTKKIEELKRGIRTKAEFKRQELKAIRDSIFEEEQYNFFLNSKSNLPFIKLFLIFLLANIIPDYVSLIETRHILGLMTEENNPFIHLMLLTLDAFLTFLIFWLGMHTFLQFGLAITGVTMNVYDINRGIIYLINNNFFLVILFITSYFTSIWAYLYILAGISIKITKPWNWLIIKGVSILDIKEKPFKAIGFFAISIISAIYICWGTILLIKNIN